MTTNRPIHGIVLSCLLTTGFLASSQAAQAQNITSANDGFNTTVNQVGSQYDITGGTQAGGNLFHSLQKLGLSSGEIANFISNPNIQNILTRVTGGEASSINGLIQVSGGNSNLFILNPAGILFGNNASLNVPANFSATTATGIQVGSGWFGVNSSVDQVRNLTGTPTGYGFTTSLLSTTDSTSTPGVLLNQGNLFVNAGQSVTLVGGIVVNTGTITTPSGKITIAATPDNKYVQITPEGSVLSLALPIADQQTLGQAAVLKGVDLPSLLVGQPTPGTTIASGKLEASGTIGGQVQVLGETVQVKNAEILANGTTGGGLIQIGGDFQGKGTTPKSNLTTVDSDSVLRSDALAQDNGGQVIIWSDGKTQFAGTASAQGGSQGGDGGLVETSGLQNLTVDPTAKVSTKAPQGQVGTWLLDPTDLIVQTGVGIAPNTIVTALDGNNLVLQASNSITVNEAIDASGNANPGNLRLDAPISNLNALITLQGTSVLSGTATTANVGASGSVQNGVDVAASGGTVNLAAATYTLSQTVGINKSLTLNGAGAANTTVSGNNAVQVFNIGNNSTVNLNGVTVAYGRAIDGAGAYINLGSTLNLNNSTFLGNTASRNGGGIINSGTANVSDSYFLGNTAGSFGGGITNTNSRIVTISNSVFSGNQATFGGGLYTNGTATISNSLFSQNQSGSAGGGLYNAAAKTVTINSSEFLENSTGGFGGGIYNRGTVAISDSTFSGNSAKSNGGGVLNDSAESIVTISDSTFSENSAKNNGGGVFSNGIVNISNSTFFENQAERNGGGVYINFGTANISNSTFSENQAGFAGGGILSFGTMTISDSNFSENQAQEGGGGFYNAGTANISNSTFSGNQAKNNGGGGFYNADTANISDSTFSGNSAKSNGGGVFNATTGRVTIGSSTFSGNSAGSFGGAVFNNTTGRVTIGSSTFSENSAGTSGGGIYSNGPANISNSTFSENRAKGGGGILNNGPANISNSTFSGNSASSIGGGIYNNSQADISNSILVGNNAPTGSELAITAGALTFRGNNLVGTNGVSGISGTFTGSTPITPTGAANTVIDTTLRNNGGLTQTLALLPGSLAIDASSTVNGATPTTADQRGISLSGAARDIGAYESAGFNLVVSNGSPQSTTVKTPFEMPFGVTVFDNSTGNPVRGGSITLTLTPPSTGASLNPSIPTVFTLALNTSGQASFGPVIANTKGGRYTVTATATGISGAATYALTNFPDIDPNQVSYQQTPNPGLSIGRPTPVVFLKADDLELQQLRSFLPEIVEHLNRTSGGEIVIATETIWKDASITLFEQSSNQGVIRTAIQDAIRQYIGVDYVSYVEIRFNTEREKKQIVIQMRKSPKLAKLIRKL